MYAHNLIRLDRAFTVTFCRKERDEFNISIKFMFTDKLYEINELNGNRLPNRIGLAHIDSSGQVRNNRTSQIDVATM